MNVSNQLLMSPRITVGMPVYNEEAHVERAIDSVLGQTFGAYELLIYDNASTDGTAKICERYCYKDPRVKFLHRSLQVAPLLNFWELLAMGKGEYFVYLAGDDYWMPDFLQETVSILEGNPGASAATVDVYLATSSTEGRHCIGTNTISGSRVNRIIKYLDQQPTDNSRFYGLFRTAILQNSFFMQASNSNFHAYDWSIMAVSLWQGSHIQVSKTLLIRDSTGAAPNLRRIESDNQGHLWLGLPLLPMTFYILRHVPIWSWPFILPSLAKINVRKLKEYRLSLK